jgi:hypothetical protein
MGAIVAALATTRVLQAASAAAASAAAASAAGSTGAVAGATASAPAASTGAVLSGTSARGLTGGGGGGPSFTGTSSFVFWWSFGRVVVSTCMQGRSSVAINGNQRTWWSFELGRRSGN